MFCLVFHTKDLTRGLGNRLCLGSDLRKYCSKQEEGEALMKDELVKDDRDCCDLILMWRDQVEEEAPQAGGEPGALKHS